MAFLLMIICSIFLGASGAKKEVYYKIVFLEVRSAPTEYMKMDFQITQNASLNADVQVFKDIQHPYWQFEVMLDHRNRTSVYFSRKLGLCDVVDYSKRVPLIHTLLASSLKTTNATFSCPFKAGYYYVKNFTFPSNASPLVLIYIPGSIVKTRTIFYDKVARKLIESGRLEIDAQIIRYY
ncbi:uncharacterized protein LOC119660082 [Hermetia illucens]|uniref:uncharacterized protein LOC119660082 n=1 Tax=Hermetia illucens TaxID=343691 RepID=UPI0018CC2B87|nr:uncharacterized protein LOC119660082 [Hermetia illucens]